MAMPLHSLTPLLLLVAVFVADAARPAGAGSDSLDKACSSTMWGATCAKVLGTIPEASKASPRRLAVLAFKYLVKEGKALLPECESAIKAPEQPGNVFCIHLADGNIKFYLESLLAKMAPEESDAKFAEARDKLTEFVRHPFGTESCSALSEPVIGKVLEYEEMLEVTADLLKNAAPAAAPPEAAPPEASTTDDEDA